MLKRWVVSGLLLGLAACASEPGPRAGGHGFRHGPPGGETGPRPGVFISPSGEPFRGPDGLQAWFAGADADHDGSITLPEFQADALRFFQVLDANHDGHVDGFEIQAYEHEIAPEITVMDFDRGPDGGARARGGMGGRRSGRRGGGPDRGGRYALINEPEPVANADENVDSRVTLEEWTHATLRRFTVLDRARTGRLTLESLRGKGPKLGPRP